MANILSLERCVPVTSEREGEKARRGEGETEKGRGKRWMERGAGRERNVSFILYVPGLWKCVCVWVGGWGGACRKEGKEVCMFVDEGVRMMFACWC